MSGIYGIFRFDGAPVDPQWMGQMRSAMAYYGPDGGGSKIDGSVGMGHLLFEVNPEDAFERQPMQVERGLMVCTARLDNRDVLLEQLDLLGPDARRLSDGNLVSLAWDRWGEEVCSHLAGDWAFAAWCAKNRRLLLGLNACGNETLYYYPGKDFIGFASSLRALLSIPGVIKEADLLRLAEVLVSWQPDGELTAYKGFRRMIWAHAMIVTAAGQMLTRRFWSPEGREPLKYRRDEDYIEGFLDHYTRAIRCCLRTSKTVSMQLSGGRDSGSVAAMAAPLLASQGRELTAFTSVPLFNPDGASKWRLGDEWDLAHMTAVMAGKNVKHVAVDARDYGVIQGIEHFLDIHSGPGHGAINHYWCQAIWEAASNRDSRVLLCGGMGNATVSWTGNGSALLALLQGYPGTALHLFFQGESNPWLTLKRQILKPALTPCRRLFRRLRAPIKNPWRAFSALNVNLAQQLDLNGRMREKRFDPTFTQDALTDYRPYFFSPSLSIAMGTASEVGAWHSFASLDPTANLSLLEFLLRVPDDQFWRRSELSSLIKRALRDRMPHEVLYSRRKGLQAADVGHRVVREFDTFQDHLHSLESVPEAREVLDLPLMHLCLNELLTAVNPDTTDRAESILLRGLGVGLFLRRLSHANG